jgi:hypothetical protein
MISGFVDADNINKVGQRISNGPHTGWPIPRLLPVSEYDDPLFDLADQSYLHITLMGAPLTVGTAREICRVLAVLGKIYLYDPNEIERRNFQAIAAANDISLIGRFDPKELETPFNQITMMAVYVYVKKPVSTMYDEL